MEDEARLQSLQPKKMKTFSESKKSDRSHVTGGSASSAATSVVATPPSQEAMPPAEVADEAAGGEGSVPKPGGGASPRAGILNKLGMRGRGGAKPDKKPATGKKYVRTIYRVSF